MVIRADARWRCKGVQSALRESLQVELLLPTVLSGRTCYVPLFWTGAYAYAFLCLDGPAFHCLAAPRFLAFAGAATVVRKKMRNFRPAIRGRMSRDPRANSAVHGRQSGVRCHVA